MKSIVTLIFIFSLNLYANELNITAACRGQYDLIQRATYVSSTTDYILSENIFTARNIKGSTSDSYCKYLTNEARVWDIINPAPTATMNDLIRYTCSQNEVKCADDPLSTMKAKYEEARSKLSVNDQRSMPPTDHFFDKVLTAGKFYDNEGKVVTLPRKLALTVMKEESQGELFSLNQYDYSLGLFGIRRATRIVKIQNGIVAGILPRGNDYHKLRTIDKYSLYNPINNFVKFVQIFQGKYLKFQQVFDGINRPLNFNKINIGERFKFVLAALQVGDENIIKAYDRLLSYNIAQNCNPCESFRKSAGVCQNIIKTCSNPHPNKCGKTLVENFDHIIRMANFTGQESNLDYQEYMSCTREQLFGNDSIGPCTLAYTKARVNKVLAGASCY